MLPKSPGVNDSEITTFSTSPIMVREKLPKLINLIYTCPFYNISCAFIQYLHNIFF